MIRSFFIPYRGYNGVAVMGTGAHFGTEQSLDARKLRVLVVEDEPDTANSMACLLALWGHAVDLAADGPTALRTASAHPPDVVFLDVGLPGLDGWAVAERLREQVTLKRPFIIAISGHGQEADKQRSEEAGVHLHWVKPVDLDALQALLTRFRALLCGPAEGERYPGSTTQEADGGAVPVNAVT
jgi:CheY-like chemotaxis protein